MKNNAGRSWGVSISITDTILAKVPFDGSPDKSHPRSVKPQCRFPTPVWSCRHGLVTIHERTRISFSSSSFDLTKTWGLPSDLCSSCYLGSHRSFLGGQWPQSELSCLVNVAHLFHGIMSKNKLIMQMRLSSLLRSPVEVITFIIHHSSQANRKTTKHEVHRNTLAGIRTALAGRKKLKDGRLLSCSNLGVKD